MASIKIVTDSASDLPAALVEQHRIRVVPLEVRLDGHDPVELAGVTLEEFWTRARASSGLAETSAPSPGQFATAFSEAKRDGYDAVCCVTISSALSATYQAALTGAKEVEGEIDVRVVDSRFATMGEGLLVLHAAVHTNDVASVDALSEIVHGAIGRTSTYGTLDTLEYLRRGGRIGTAQAFVGSMLSIKPIIEVRDGAVEGESRQRTRARSFRYLVEKIAALGPLDRLAVVHADARDVDEFVALLSEIEVTNEPIVTLIGPVIGAHTGPGTIGVCALAR